MSENGVSRRGLLRSAAGATAAAGAASATSTTAAAQTEEPAWDYAADVDGGYEDLRGQDAVTIMVGAGDDGLAFSPARAWIDPGTTVTWEWTGEGGEHNVVTETGPADLESPLTAEAGFEWEFDFTEDHEGMTGYHCEPHESVDMLGEIAVGDGVETVEVGGGAGGAPQIPDTARTLGVATFVAMVSTLLFAFFFLKYGGDYADVS